LATEAGGTTSLSDRTTHSDGTERGGTNKPKQRILKSHEVSGTGFAFPALEQIATGDLPPSVSSAPAPDPGFLTPSEVQGRLVAAREAEARAHASERRAAALLAEAEETALVRLSEVEGQIEDMLSRALGAVEQIEAEARERGLKTGKDEGLRHGIEAGRREGEEIVRRAKAEADGILKEARRTADGTRTGAIQLRSSLLESSRVQVVDLASAIARQILKSELTLYPEALVPMVEAALAKMKGEEEPLVRVSPAVLTVLEEQRGRLLAALPGSRRLTVEGDAALRPTDFMVQGTQGVVDGRLEEQLKLVDRTLREER